jgi:hypothetical protein
MRPGLRRIRTVLRTRLHAHARSTLAGTARPPRAARPLGGGGLPRTFVPDSPSQARRPYRSQNRPAPALAPRRRKFGERFGPPRPRSGGRLRRAFVCSQTKARPAAVQSSCRCAPCRQSLRRLPDRPRASYARQNSPSRTRSLHAGGNSASASGGTPLEAACSLRNAFLRSQTRARSAAVRPSCRCAPRRQPLRATPARTARSRPIHAGGNSASASAARARGGVLLAYGIRAHPD